MTATIIWTVLIIAVIATGVGLAVVATSDTGQRASGDRSFRRIDWDTPSPHLHLAPGLSIDVLPCEEPGSYLELHHDLPGRDTGPATPPRGTHGDTTAVRHALAGEPHHRAALAPWVAIALANATVGDTVIGPVNDRIPVDPWLEQVTGGDPWDGLGSSDAYVDRLFYALAGAS